MDDWIQSEDDQDDGQSLREYDITASPNDFNILTLFSFIGSGAVKIPGFQRNYIWDIKRASRLIESLIIGLPIPQIFLYEEGKNKFLVIDGQQRLMSIYYFMNKRFPKEEKRAELRQIFDEHGEIPQSIFENDDYFSKFALRLTDPVAGRRNRLNRLNYDTLDDLRTAFDLRTIRNVIIKQNSPDDEDSSIYEIFSRLNSGGVNLTAQEIRTSLYHSRFYDLLYRLNLEPRWRRLLGMAQPDLHMRDVEILLRGFAMMVSSDEYAPSMKRFLNVFSKKARSVFGAVPRQDTSSVLKEDAGRESDQTQKIQKIQNIFEHFVEATKDLPDRAFFGKVTGKFNVSVFDAVFTAVTQPMWRDEVDTVAPIESGALDRLKEDSEFVSATLRATADTANVKKRLQRARAVLANA
jgi:hypothetical protein